MSRQTGLAPGWAIAVCAVLAVVLSAPAAAQQPNVDFSVSGTSTIRSWTCSVRGVLTVAPGTGGPAVPGFPGGVQGATLVVPVKGFKCPNDEMTQHLQEAMKSDQHAEIRYRLDKYTVNGARAEAVGAVTILGVTAPLNFPLSVAAAGQGLQVEGNARLDMTKFGVEPPVVMLGLLKVGPQIRIEFKGVVAR